MQQIIEEGKRRQTFTPAAREQVGCYVYCVALGNDLEKLGAIGIEGREVYTVPYNDVGAIVNDCPPQPYQSQDSLVAASWVLAHHRVVETAWKRGGTVLPMTFNTIINAEQGKAEEKLREWLKIEYEMLKRKLEALSGKAEYVVQVFWDPAVIAREITETSHEIRKLEAEIGAKPRGLAYMYRQRLESLIEKELEARVAEEFRDTYSQLERYVDKMHIEKTKKAEAGRQMLLNLSCLLSRERQPELETELAKIGAQAGHYIRLAGPLPPYSFC